MLRYKTETRPGLVALYNIRPVNGVGQFLQPRTPHGGKERERERDKRPATIYCTVLDNAHCISYYFWLLSMFSKITPG